MSPSTGGGISRILSLPRRGRGLWTKTAARRSSSSACAAPDAASVSAPEPGGGSQASSSEGSTHGTGPQARDGASEASGSTNAASPAATSSAPALEQGSAEWQRVRRWRLTASAFANALGFFDGSRQELWKEKIGLRPPFEGNAATQWGTTHEPEALAAYCALTGFTVSRHLSFQLYGPAVLAADSWLGASPDGLIVRCGSSPASFAAGFGLAAGGGEGEEGRPDGEAGGVLEIKCPFNKGAPEAGAPWELFPWY